MQHIQPGVAQHFAENVFAIVNHLTNSPSSPLARLETTHTPPQTLFLSVFGKYFVHYTHTTSWTILLSMLSLSLVILGTTTELSDYRTIGMASLGVLGSVVGSVFGASLAASIMAKVLGAGMSWYTREYSCFILYGPPAITGTPRAPLFHSLLV